MHREKGPTGRMFRLIRADDESDISGTGHVATGVEWADLSVSLKWHTNGSCPADIAHHGSMNLMLRRHGNAGKTRVEYVDASEQGNAPFILKFSEFVHTLGDHLEKVEKGIPTSAHDVRKQFLRVLDAAEALKQRIV